MSACATVGSVWPTLSVPGITRSSTDPKNFQIEVVVAKEPIPSVSKKLVTKPIAVPPAPGPRRRAVARPRASRIHVTRKGSTQAPRAMKRIVLPLIEALEDTRQPRRVACSYIR